MVANWEMEWQVVTRWWHRESGMYLAVFTSSPNLTSKLGTVITHSLHLAFPFSLIPWHHKSLTINFWPRRGTYYTVQEKGKRKKEKGKGIDWVYGKSRGRETEARYYTFPFSTSEGIRSGPPKLEIQTEGFKRLWETSFMQKRSRWINRTTIDQRLICRCSKIEHQNTR